MRATSALVRGGTVALAVVAVGVAASGGVSVHGVSVGGVSVVGMLVDGVSLGLVPQAVAAKRTPPRAVTLRSWLRARDAVPTAAQLRQAHPRPARALERIANNPRERPSLRRRAVTLLAVLPGSVSRAALWRLVQRRGEPQLRSLAVAAWCAGPGSRAEPKAAARAFALLNHPTPSMRAAAAHGLRWFPRARQARDQAARRRGVERDPRVLRALDAAILGLDRRLGRGKAAPRAPQKRKVSPTPAR